MILILLVAAAVVTAERLIKAYVETEGENWRGKMLGGNLQREKVYNPGLILGFLKKKQVFANILSGAAVLTVAVYAVVRSIKGMTLAAKLGFGLFLGGAISNLAERITSRHVTDYFSFCRALPKKLRRVVFNLADICIFVGAVIAAIFES